MSGVDALLYAFSILVVVLAGSVVYGMYKMRGVMKK